MAEKNQPEVAAKTPPVAADETEVVAPKVKTIENRLGHDCNVITGVTDGAAIAEHYQATADLSSITTTDLSKLRVELRQTLQEEESVLNDRIKLLQERRDLACRVEVGEAEELIAGLTLQQEKLQVKKLRMQLEEMYF